MFAKAKFLLSAVAPEHFPRLLDVSGKPLPEVAVVGRSNVGKSSLINHLTNHKNLAKVSRSPGKTQTINFFSIEERICLVDLPGYGFAKVSKNQREKWGRLIDEYLEKRECLKLILLLCDLRHPPTKDDIAFAKWALHYKRDLLIVFTKGDKLKRNARAAQVEKNKILLSKEIGDKPLEPIEYSIKESKGRNLLIKRIEHGIAS
ncbi:MAG: putative GTP-binding protein EngB [Chlamydiae bacterium]|nr:putative GTP-binding protein EngB [Chlamydiota bacterium]